MRRLILITGLILSLSGHTLEVKPVKDNAAVEVIISSKSLNRIFVTTDRIVETYGVEGAYRIEKEEEGGSIFIIPMGYYRKKPFDLLLKTEHGHHYTLNITPSDLEAQTIALKPLSPAKDQAERWELSAPYADTLIDLIKDMVAGKSPEGYAVIPMGNNQPVETHAKLDFRLMTLYRGDHLEGQVWSVRNVGHQEIYLESENFEDDLVLASYFDKRSLKVNETAKVYWVKNHAT